MQPAAARHAEIPAPVGARLASPALVPTTRALVALLFLLLACIASARAADDGSQRAFTLEIGVRDDELREHCSRRLSAWWDEIVSPANPPKGWDEKRLGPWSLVAGSAGGGFVEERPGLVHGIVNVVAEGLPSREASADAFANAVVAALEERISTRARSRDEDRRMQIESELARHQSAAKLAAVDIRIQLEAKKVQGDVVREADDLGARLSDLRRDRSETRIALAVAAKRLEAARAAAERAVEVERLQRDVGRLAGELLMSKVPPDDPVRVAAERKLAEIRAKSEELQKATPSLDSAREEVFRVELDRIGLEARAVAVDRELAEASARFTDIRVLRTIVETKTREIDEARARADDLARRLHEIDAERLRRGPPVEVIRRPGPPSKVFPPAGKQEEKR